MTDKNRPAHLTRENAAHFEHQSIVDRYHLRLPYPEKIFEILLSLIRDEPRNVLDIGTGTGELARTIVTKVSHVDALDASETMIERGKTLSHGNHPKLNWIHGIAETVTLNPPYALIMGGESFHWLDWEIAFPRFATMLTENGMLAIIYRRIGEVEWEGDLTALIKHYSTQQNYQAYDLIEELSKRGLFEVHGEEHASAEYKQSVEDYIASFHSRSSLSLDVLSEVDAKAFDERLQSVVNPFAEDIYLNLISEARVTWGKPLAKSS